MRYQLRSEERNLKSALPVKNHSAPPNGASRSCLSVYKHVTPHGVKFHVRADQMTGQPLSFEVTARDGEARAGILTTARAVIETPVFMPVGTAGTVKGIRFEELESADLDAQMVLVKTYHLWLRPGLDVIKACGGLHKFTGWNRAMLTDSGGFQVWSLGKLRKITEEGTEFRSHIDGALCFLSPEISMAVQAALGAEIAMAFDECAPGEATPEEARASMELTLRWAKRSKDAFDPYRAATSRGSERGSSPTVRE